MYEYDWLNVPTPENDHSAVYLIIRRRKDRRFSEQWNVYSRVEVFGNEGTAFIKNTVDMLNGPGKLESR